METAPLSSVYAKRQGLSVARLRHVSKTEESPTTTAEQPETTAAEPESDEETACPSDENSPTISPR
jgi:hypothetical protein